MGPLYKDRNSAKILINCKGWAETRNPGGHKCKRSLHLLADASVDLHLGAYGKDWLWEQSVEKSVLGVGAQRRDWLPLPEKHEEPSGP